MSENKLKVMVFGFNFNKQIILNNTELSFVDNLHAQNLSGFDFLIYLPEVFPFKYEGHIMGQHLVEAPAEAIRREKEIRIALEQGKIVCFIGYDACDYVISGVLDSSKIYERYIHDNRAICSNVIVKRSEFKPFLATVGASRIYFDKNTIDDIICTTDYDLVLGFSKNVGKGKVLFIPCTFGSRQLTYLVDNLEKLVNGLISFTAKKNLEAPSYVDKYQFKNELNTALRIKEITEKEIMPLQAKVAFYAQLKRILWLGDNKLVEATCNFFENLGLKTKIDEIGEEDFWLLTDEKEIAIVEVKGLNNNLSREDIAKADTHREARQVPDLTGLLIANTFMTAQSIDRKNEAFSTNVIEKAVLSNMIITRTLDLCNVYDYLEQNKLTYKSLLEAIIGKKGWLTIENNRITVKIR